MERFLALLDRIVYTPPTSCATCPETFWQIFTRHKLCPSCRETLADPRQRTTSKPRREWPVELSKVRRIGARRG